VYYSVFDAGISIDDLPVQIAFAGDNVILTLTGIDSTNLSIGTGN